ncbi:MAG: hypothetical protein ACMXYK_03755 [Candidatus Woesearchaeota archaeon]
MSVLQQGVMYLVQNGLVPLLIFGLVFVITYGMLRKAKLFVKGDKLDDVKNVHTIIALAFSVLVVLPYFTARGSQYDVVSVVEMSLPQVSFLMVAILGALILLGFFGMSLGGGDPKKSGTIRMFVFLATVGFIVYVFGANMGARWDLPRFLTPDLVAVIIAILVFSMVVLFVMGKTPNSAKGDKKLSKQFQEFIKGK